jgi:xanthine dehydrogenase iron-sulfur cluster and FAD-binding subunit A
MHPDPAPRHRPRATTVAGLAAAALATAVIPAAAALAFLISLAARRPLVGLAARRWPWLTGRSAAQPSHRTLTGLTAAWGIGLLAAAAVQGAGAITGGLAFTSPAGFTARALIALAIEVILAAITIAWLHRSPVRGPQHKPMTPTG